MNDSLDENELSIILKKAVPSWHKMFITQANGNTSQCCERLLNTS
jgi:hypothetical protein